MTIDEETIYFLDTSVLVKLVTSEHDSGAVRDYVFAHGPRYTTALCFAEALGVLKGKRFRRKLTDLNQDEYETATHALVALLKSLVINIEPIDVTDHATMFEALDLSRKYEIDLADTIQIVALRQCNVVDATLITADAALADATLKEFANRRVRIWHPATGIRSS